MEILRNMYVDSTMKKSAVYEWYMRFRSSRQETTDNARSGRPASVTPSNVVTIKTLLDKRMTIRELRDRVDCSLGTVHKIIHEDLNMRRLCARWISKMLNVEQKKQKVQSCTVLASARVRGCALFWSLLLQLTKLG